MIKKCNLSLFSLSHSNDQHLEFLKGAFYSHSKCKGAIWGFSKQYRKYLTDLPAKSDEKEKDAGTKEESQGQPRASAAGSVQYQETLKAGITPLLIHNVTELQPQWF